MHQVYHIFVNKEKMEGIIKKHLFETEEEFKQNVAAEVGCSPEQVQISRSLEYNKEKDVLVYKVALPCGEYKIESVKVTW